MRVDQFDFELPQDRIALRPARPRDSARLLLVEGDRISDKSVLDLSGLLHRGDVLVFNDTRAQSPELGPIVLCGRTVDRGEGKAGGDHTGPDSTEDDRRRVHERSSVARVFGA